MKPFNSFGEVIGEEPFKRFAVPVCRLSLLGLGGGGGGLGLSASASDAYTGPQSGGTITVNNGASGSLSQKTWLIIAGVALVAIILIGIIFRGRH